MKTQICEFTIHLRDATLCSSLQAQLAAGTGPQLGALIALPTGGVGVLRGPQPAGAEFGALAGGGALPLIKPGQTPPTTGAGFVTSAWFASTQYPVDRAVFEIKSHWWVEATKFYWSGHFALAPSTTFTNPDPTVPPPPLPVATRLFLCGYEQPTHGEIGGFTGAGTMTGHTTPAASRTGDGLGIRAASTTTGQSPGAMHVRLSKLRPAVTDVSDLWVRLYVRPRRYPGINAGFVELLTSGAPGPGFNLMLTPGGQLALYQNAGWTIGTQTLLQTFTTVLPLGAWARLDLLMGVTGTDSESAGLQVYVNGAKLGEDGFTTGPTPGRVWERIDIGWGYSLFATPHVGEMDFDDILGARGPVAALDLAQGSHLVRVAPDGFGPNHDPAWTGDVAFLQRRHFPSAGNVLAGLGLKTAVASALAEVTLPVETALDAHPFALGIAAWQVVVFSHRSNALSGRLGYQVGAEPVVITPINEADVAYSVGDYRTMTGSVGGGLDVLPAGTALTLRYENATDGVASAGGGLAALVAIVELRGSFGPEDVPTTVPALTFPKPTPVHLIQGRGTPWARDVLPAAEVVMQGDVYEGTGTAVVLRFMLPVTWLGVREIVTSGRATRWWPSLTLPHEGGENGMWWDQNPPMHHAQNYAYVPATPDADQQLEFTVRLDGQLTEAGRSYEYIALLDPARRFTCAFAGIARREGTTTGDTGTRTFPLDELSFVPEAAVGVVEFDVQSGAATSFSPVFLKTPGHAPAAATSIESPTTLLSDAVTFGGGALTLGDSLITHDDLENAGLLCLRRNDGNDESAGRVLFFGSYVGDGTASRVVPLGAATGRRPMYAEVVRESGGPAYHRDPAHTGTNSTLAGGGGLASTTAIIGGGLDSMTVGVAVNVNGATYHYWGFYGSEAAGNGGWSTNGTFIVPPDSPKPPDWEEPEPIDPDPGGPDPGGPDDGYPIDPGAPGSDIEIECVEASTRIVNLALQEIGITKQITSLGYKPLDEDDDPDAPREWADTSQEAYAARMIYRTLVDTVLRDDDWAFTREYATLYATAGTREVPVNPDWTYSYTLPVDCLRVKRVCVPETQRRYSTEPVPFDRRSAALGYVDVLLCNEPGGGLLPLTPPPTYSGEGPIAIPDPLPGAPAYPGGVPPAITIEYAKRIHCPARVSDAQFRECLVFRLAAGLAKALARDSADADRCLRNYHMARPRALVNQANDQEPQRPTRGLPDWTTGR